MHVTFSNDSVKYMIYIIMYRYNIHGKKIFTVTESEWWLYV